MCTYVHVHVLTCMYIYMQYCSLTMLVINKHVIQTLYVDVKYSKISILMEYAKCWIFPNLVTIMTIPHLCVWDGCVWELLYIHCTLRISTLPLNKAMLCCKNTHFCIILCFITTFNLCTSKLRWSQLTSYNSLLYNLSKNCILLVISLKTLTIWLRICYGYCCSDDCCVNCSNCCR